MLVAGLSTLGLPLRAVLNEGEKSWSSLSSDNGEREACTPAVAAAVAAAAVDDDDDDDGNADVAEEVDDEDGLSMSSLPAPTTSAMIKGRRAWGCAIGDCSSLRCCTSTGKEATGILLPLAESIAAVVVEDDEEDEEEDEEEDGASIVGRRSTMSQEIPLE